MHCVLCNRRSNGRCQRGGAHSRWSGERACRAARAIPLCRRRGGRGVEERHWRRVALRLAAHCRAVQSVVARRRDRGARPAKCHGGRGHRPHWQHPLWHTHTPRTQARHASTRNATQGAQGGYHVDASTNSSSRAVATESSRRLNFWRHARSTYDDEPCMPPCQGPFPVAGLAPACADARRMP